MANSAVVGALRVILEADVAQFDKEMKRVNSSMNAWTKDLNSIGRQAQAVGTSLTKFITLPLVGLAAGAIKAAIDFESSFANVAKTVDGVADSSGVLTAKGQELALTFRQMAKEIPLTTDELTKIAALGGQMGVGLEDLEEFTRNVAALGVAVDGISTEEAAAGLAQIGNIAGRGTKDIAQMSSALVHLGNNSNATEGDILEFTKRLMGAGHAVGMTVPEVMALGTSMANVGINAEAGGTAMSTMIGKMSMAVSQGGDALRAFDQIVAHTGKNFKDLWSASPVEAVNAVVVGLSKAKASGQDLNLVVRDIGATNVRTADTMKRLAGAGDGVAKSLVDANEGWSAGNKHIEEAEKKFATTANQLKLLWNRIKDVGITLGAALLPAVNALIDATDILLPLIERLAKGFAQLPAFVQAITVGLLGLAAAAGPALWLFGQLAIAAGTVTATFTAKGIATRLLTADLVLLTSGLRAQVVAAAATTTAYGALGAASIALTGVVRALWAVLAAHPFAAIATAAALAGGAIASFYSSSKQAAAAAMSDSVKRDTIALAERNGILLKSRDITERYLEAVDNLNYRENLRLGLVDRNLELERRQIEMRVKAGQISREQGNVLLAEMAIGEKAAAVQQKRISFTEAAAIAEKEYREEIKATGYTEAQLRAMFQKDEKTFQNFAKQVGLSSESLDRLKGSIKTVTKEGKDFDKATREAAEGLADFARAADKAAQESAEKRKTATDRGLMQMADLEADYLIERERETLSATEFQLREIDRWVASMKAGFNGALSQQQAYYDAVDRIAANRRAPFLAPSLPNVSKVANPFANLNLPNITQLFGPSPGAQMAKSFGADFAANIGPTILSAIQGGGSPVQAVGSMAGMSLGTSFVKNFGQNITGKLGATIGGAITSMIPGLGAMLGPLMGKLSGWVVGLFTGGEGAKANDLRDSLKAQLFKAVEGLENDPAVRAALERFNRAGRREDVQSSFTDAMEAADKARKVMESYGLSLDDLKSPQERVAAGAQKLVNDFNQLRSLGFSNEQATRALSGALNDLVETALESGQQIPAALAPMLQQLVMTGQLTDDLAAKLLGVASPVPWQEMEAAAERYGISIDALGKKFEQSKLDESAKQMAADWKLLTENGADVNAVMAGMSDEVNELVNKAIKLGLQIPESMKPLIDAMFEAGQLTDENGDKLEDISKLEYSKPIISDTDKLIAKLDELIEKLTGPNGLRGAFEDASDFRQPDFDGGRSTNPGSEPPGFEGGTKGKFFNFGAGTLAMLHGWEAVVPKTEVEAFEKTSAGSYFDFGSAAPGLDGGQDRPLSTSDGLVQLTIVRDGRKEAEWFAPFLAGEARRLRLAY